MLILESFDYNFKEQEREQAADRARREAVEAQRRAEERVKEESARVREKQKEEQNAQLAESFRRTLTRQMLANSLRTKLGDTGASRFFACLFFFLTHELMFLNGIIYCCSIIRN